MNNEKSYSPASGYLMILICFGILTLGIAGLIAARSPFFILFVFTGIMTMPGFFFLNPNSSMVLVLFGDYRGTVKSSGFFWVNPLFSRKKISLRARNFDSEKIKVNDKVGNPIQIGVILVWQVKDTYKAAFEVDNYENFVRIQSDAG